MGTQDKIERILKRIHVLFAEGQSVAGDSDKVIVDKKEVFSILEEMNLAIYEMMDNYEATRQAREMAQRRSEKKGEELLARVSRQTEDVYAASLLYTDDALGKINRMMTEAVNASRDIWRQLSRDIEREQQKIREDQSELREQLKDFRDSNKYLNIIEECNREREKQEQQEKASPPPEKKIQNEAKHYALNLKPEIRVNPAYFERRGIRPDGTKIEPENSPKKDVAEETDSWTEDFIIEPLFTEDDDIPPMPVNLKADESYTAPEDSTEADVTPMHHLSEEEEKEPFAMPEIKVDLDAEYFKWQEENLAALEEDETVGRRASKRERRFLFGKK